MRQTTTAEVRPDGGKQRVWRRELTLLAIFAAKGPAAIEFRCGDAAMTEKSYQPSRESGECRLTYGGIHAETIVRYPAGDHDRWDKRR